MGLINLCIFNFELILCKMGSSFIFACVASVLPAPFVEGTVLFLPCVLGTRVKGQLAVWVYSWALCGVGPYVCLHASCYCSNFCGFVMYFEVQACDVSQLFALC